MALVKCKECGGEVSTEATACPKCGAPVKAAYAPRAKTSPITLGCAGIIVLGVAMSIVGQFTKGVQENKAASIEIDRRAKLTPEQKAAEDKQVAEVAAANAKAEAERTEHTGTVYACRTFIKQTLKDPDSVDWTDLADNTYFERRKNGRLFAQLQARAKNSFGAKILTTFDCTVTRTGDNWKLTSLKEH